MKNKNHVITRANRAECGAVCQNDRLSTGHIWQTRSHVYGEVKCQTETRSDVVIHNKLGNSNTCNGLLRRFVHKNTNNNEFSPHNDMNNKILNQVQDDNVIVVQNNITTCPPLEGGPKSLISRRGKNALKCKQEPSPEFVRDKNKLDCFAFARTKRIRLTPLSSARVAQNDAKDKNRKRLINLSTYRLIDFKNVMNLFPYFPISFSPKKKAAFTLAEVLITLGIIGIVAAMTIPTLISNYQKKQTVTKLQKAISVLNQAYKLSFDDVGEPSAQEAYDMGSEQYFKTYWAPYIKTALICTNYKQCGYKKLQPWVFTNNEKHLTAVVVQGNRATFYTADGFLYVIFTAIGATGSEEENHRVIVDINGAEGPNKLGRDVFYLTRVEKDGAGIQTFGMDKSDKEVNEECSSTGQGYYCAERIRRAGWEIDKSYPWK